jgi:hypothetical protein
MEEQGMENLRLENFWHECLTRYGWSERAVKQSVFALAASTRQGYNNILTKCKHFTDSVGVDFPPRESKDLAEFLCSLGDSSNRPSSLLHTALAALSHVYCAKSLLDITKDTHIKRLVQAIVKSQTVIPMKKSAVLPVSCFTELFCAWGANCNLSVKQLRLKAITLLALALMLRPSDVAPKATMFQSSDSSFPVLFTKDMLSFNANGVKITFFGIKNDAQRTGFEVFLPRHDNVTLDPVQTLQDYLQRTECVRTGGAVFLALRKPHGALSASGIAKILEESIMLAGLSGQGFSAKSFRPTGATMAIEQGIEPHVVQKMGRWKSADVFYQHYVHSKTPSNFASSIIKP